MNIDISIGENVVPWNARIVNLYTGAVSVTNDGKSFIARKNSSGEIDVDIEYPMWNRTIKRHNIESDKLKALYDYLETANIVEETERTVSISHISELNVNFDANVDCAVIRIKFIANLIPILNCRNIGGIIGYDGNIYESTTRKHENDTIFTPTTEIRLNLDNLTLKSSGGQIHSETKTKSITASRPSEIYKKFNISDGVISVNIDGQKDLFSSIEEALANTGYGTHKMVIFVGSNKDINMEETKRFQALGLAGTLFKFNYRKILTILDYVPIADMGSISLVYPLVDSYSGSLVPFLKEKGALEIEPNNFSIKKANSAFSISKDGAFVAKPKIFSSPVLVEWFSGKEKYSTTINPNFYAVPQFKKITSVLEQGKTVNINIFNHLTYNKQDKNLKPFLQEINAVSLPKLYKVSHFGNGDIEIIRDSEKEGHDHEVLSFEAVVSLYSFRHTFRFTPCFHFYKRKMIKDFHLYTDAIYYPSAKISYYKVGEIYVNNSLDLPNFKSKLITEPEKMANIVNEDAPDYREVMTGKGEINSKYPTLHIQYCHELELDVFVVTDDNKLYAFRVIPYVPILKRPLVFYPKTKSSIDVKKLFKLPNSARININDIERRTFSHGSYELKNGIMKIESNAKSGIWWEGWENVSINNYVVSVMFTTSQEKLDLGTYYRAIDQSVGETVIQVDNILPAKFHHLVQLKDIESPDSSVKTSVTRISKFNKVNPSIKLTDLVSTALETRANAIKVESSVTGIFKCRLVFRYGEKIIKVPLILNIYQESKAIERVPANSKIPLPKSLWIDGRPFNHKKGGWEVVDNMLKTDASEPLIGILDSRQVSFWPVESVIIPPKRIEVVADSTTEKTILLPKDCKYLQYKSEHDCGLYKSLENLEDGSTNIKIHTTGVSGNLTIDYENLGQKKSLIVEIVARAAVTHTTRVVTSGEEVLLENVGNFTYTTSDYTLVITSGLLVATLAPALNIKIIRVSLPHATLPEATIDLKLTVSRPTKTSDDLIFGNLNTTYSREFDNSAVDIRDASNSILTSTYKDGFINSTITTNITDMHYSASIYVSKAMYSDSEPIHPKDTVKRIGAPPVKESLVEVAAVDAATGRITLVGDTTSYSKDLYELHIVYISELFTLNIIKEPGDIILDKSEVVPLLDGGPHDSSLLVTMSNPEMGIVKYSSSGIRFLEVLPEGVNKGSVLFKAHIDRRHETNYFSEFHVSWDFIKLPDIITCEGTDVLTPVDLPPGSMFGNPEFPISDGNMLTTFDGPGDYTYWFTPYDGIRRTVTIRVFPLSKTLNLEAPLGHISQFTVYKNDKMAISDSRYELSVMGGLGNIKGMSSGVYFLTLGLYALKIELVVTEVSIISTIRTLASSGVDPIVPNIFIAPDCVRINDDIRRCTGDIVNSRLYTDGDTEYRINFTPTNTNTTVYSRKGNLDIKGLMGAADLTSYNLTYLEVNNAILTNGGTSPGFVMTPSFTLDYDLTTDQEVPIKIVYADVTSSLHKYLTYTGNIKFKQIRGKMIIPAGDSIEYEGTTYAQGINDDGQFIIESVPNDVSIIPIEEFSPSIKRPISTTTYQGKAAYYNFSEGEYIASTKAEIDKITLVYETTADDVSEFVIRKSTWYVSNKLTKEQDSNIFIDTPSGSIGIAQVTDAYLGGFVNLNNPDSKFTIGTHLYLPSGSYINIGANNKITYAFLLGVYVIGYINKTTGTYGKITINSAY
jgi:hypothetical protein